MSNITYKVLGLVLAGGLMAGLTGCASDSGTAARQPQAVETYVKGVYAYQAGNKDNAIRQLQDAIKENPGLIMPRVMLGKLYKDKNDYKSAAGQYEVLVQVDPYFAEHHYNLGVSYQMLERLREAAKSYQNALKLEPNNFGSNMNLGLVYMALGEVDQAVKYTDRAVRLNPKSAEAYANLGVALDSRGDYTMAESAYRKSLELAPKQVGTLLNYANNLIAQQKPQQALTVLDDARKMEDTPYIHKRIGDAQTLAGQYEVAVVEYDTALVMNGKYTAAMNELGRALVFQYRAGMELDDKKRDRAIALWQKSLEINPNQPKVKTLLDDWEKRMFSK